MNGRRSFHNTNSDEGATVLAIRIMSESLIFDAATARDLYQGFRSHSEFCMQMITWAAMGLLDLGRERLIE